MLSKPHEDVPSLPECAECVVTRALPRFDYGHATVDQREVALPPAFPGFVSPDGRRSRARPDSWSAQLVASLGNLHVADPCYARPTGRAATKIARVRFRQPIEAIVSEA